MSDLNADLIETYRAVKLEPERVIKVLGRFQNTESFYYKIRDSRPRSSAGRAAKFIYLNQTSFNGIYRVNLRGIYNVPFGFRSTDFLNAEAIHAASKALRNAHLDCGDFFSALDRIKRGDFVFLDPPYTVSHNKNGFIKYNEKLFSLVDQHRLREFIGRLEERGANYVLTNANHPVTRELFDTGRNVSIELHRSNLVGGLNAKRGRTTELLFTNISGFNRE